MTATLCRSCRGELDAQPRHPDELQTQFTHARCPTCGLHNFVEFQPLIESDVTHLLITPEWSASTVQAL